MKRYNLYIAAFLMGLFLFNACQDEDLVKKTEVVEGIPVTLKLKLGATGKEEITTRVALEKEQENKVYDVYVYVFRRVDSSWEIEHGQLFSYPGGEDGPRTISINNVTSGPKRIYAVANAVTSGFATEEELKKVSSFADLEGMTFRMNQKSVNRIGGALLMSGHLRDNNDQGLGEGDCTIPTPTGGNNVVQVDGQIELMHLDSKITFNIKTGSDSVFVPKEWRVIHVPKTSNVLLLGNDCARVDSDYFNTEFQSFEEYKIEERGNLPVYKGGSFTFYMMENRKGMKEGKDVPTNLNPNQYGYEREKEEKEDSGENKGSDENKVFEYADDRATYVILKGSFYAYKNGSMELQTSADVTYTVHLGYWDKKFSNFASERNKNYTYNVTVNGVEKIVVEVVSGEENQPGAEGDVVRSAQNILLDAHYETRCVTFYKDQLKNLAFRVKSPGRWGQYNYSTDKSEGDTTDINWVKFLRNQGASKEYQKYPQKEDQGKLLNITQVLKELSANKDKDGFWKKDTDESGKEVDVVRYTVFVDEFYYEDKSWKEFVNVPNRELHILCKTEESKDKESSLTTSSILLSQRSIKTFYNTKKEGLSTAWGVETINEDEGYEMKYTGGIQDHNYEDGEDVRSNGRYMTFKQTGLFNGNLSWDTYVDFRKNENWREKGDGRVAKAAQFACFSRNRDLNGDGVIDADEVRWYVPATNQYIGLWTGRDALEPEARLFQADPKTVPEDGPGYDCSARSKYHFFSSNGTRFWSEEGTSTGSNNFGSYQVTVRCARNLYEHSNGGDVPTSTPPVIDYVSFEEDKDGYYHFDLSRVGELALRSESDGERGIETHTEHNGSVMNRPYNAFQVNKNNTSTCPDGWRKPNQRELVIMLGYMDPNDFGTKGDRLGSCTGSDLTFKSSDWLFYVLSTARGLTEAYLTIDPSATATTYRCVKDVVK